jgi:hypothetical protein
MSATQLTVVAIALGVVVGVVLLFWTLASSNRMAREDHTQPESLEALKDARIDPGEKVASPIGEEIESLVQAELRSHPDLANHQVDFATAPDESLTFWIDGVAYHDLNDIPDESIRDAVRSAVEKFNKKP